MLGNRLSLCQASQGHPRPVVKERPRIEGTLSADPWKGPRTQCRSGTGIPMHTGARAGRKRADASQVLPREAEDGAGVRTQDTLQRLQKPLALGCGQGNRFSVKGTRPNCSLVKRKGG